MGFDLQLIADVLRICDLERLPTVLWSAIPIAFLIMGCSRC